MKQFNITNLITEKSQKECWSFLSESLRDAETNLNRAIGWISTFLDWTSLLNLSPELLGWTSQLNFSTEPFNWTSRLNFKIELLNWTSQLNFSTEHRIPSRYSLTKHKIYNENKKISDFTYPPLLIRNYLKGFTHLYDELQGACRLYLFLKLN